MGRHSVAEDVEVTELTDVAEAAGVVALVPRPRQAFRPAGSPFGYFAPPAGLDGPLPGPPLAPPSRRVAALAAGTPTAWPDAPSPRRRTTVSAALGAVAASAALLVAGGATLTALVGAVPADTPSAGTTGTTGTTAAAQQCTDTVAGMLDDTVDSLANPSMAHFAESVATHQSTLASAYGSSSGEYLAYSSAASQLGDWLTDDSDTESYEGVVRRVVPTIISTCGQAYG